jgi:tetratricopeptide (TPR) repeat protein
MSWISRALDLDPALADAHALLGWASLAYNWDWEKAETSFLRAQELAPSCALARQWYSLLLAALGRHDEAMVQIDYAVQLDPLSLLVQTTAGIVLHFGRKYDLAIERFKAALAADPSIQIVYFHLGRVYYAIGDYSNAIAQLEKVPSRFPTAIAALGAAYAKAGQKGKALEILQELQRTSESQYVGPLPFAVLYLALGNMNTALKF